MFNNIKDLTNAQIEKYRDDYKNYEGLIFNDATLYNPLAEIPKEFEDSPHLFFTLLLSNPNYLSFFCKEILNIQPLLYQNCILKELWNRKFPMLVGSRGMGKAISPNEVVRVKNGWKKIKHIKVGDKVYSSSGKLCNVTYKTKRQKDLDFYKIKFSDGRSIECCKDHLWKVQIDNNLEDEVVKTSFIVENFNKYTFNIRNCEVIDDDNQEDLELHPYVMGFLLGAGCLTSRIITFLCKDQEVANRIDSLLPNGYKLYRTRKNQYQVQRLNNSVYSFRKFCTDIGIFNLKMDDKFIPEKYKYGTYGNRLELLKGLIDSSGDVLEDKIFFNHPSKKLAYDVSNLARSIKIQTKTRKYNDKYNYQYTTYYKVQFRTNKKIFNSIDKIKKFKLLENEQDKVDKVKIVKITYIGKKDGICITVDSPDRTYITKDYLVTHNTFLLSVYIILRASILQGRKIVVAGSGFRQSKLLYEYCSTIWNNAPILRSAVMGYPGKSGPVGGNDAVHFYIGDSKIIFIPIGSGDGIRGLRANDIIVDEFASHSKEIFEHVIAGFAAVEGSPHEKVSSALETEFNKIFNLGEENIQDSLNISNQIIISGTAYYHFNHFAEYWKKWHDIITSKGDEQKLLEIFPDGIEEGFDWKDYSIIRMPYDLLPKKYMDSGNIARSKATLSSTLFAMEMQAIFSKDSNGFFKASLIESCIANDRNNIQRADGVVKFLPILNGVSDRKYYMGIDTASQFDNFAIVILEIHKDHRRIVYCWTTNSKKFKEMKKENLIEDTDFFRYCSTKIRDLMYKFNIECIAIDSQGGGRTIYESLHDKKSLRPGEQMLWEKIEPDKRKDTDGEEGLHIIEMVNFRKPEYTTSANNGLKKDFEEKVCLFPEYNPAILASYSALNHSFALEMEDCISDIEELKKELTQIVVTASATGVERFDTPEVKISGSEKGRYKKDRYSALLVANTSARNDYISDINYTNRSIEDIANKSANSKGCAFIGPSWLTSKYQGLYD